MKKKIFSQPPHFIIAAFLIGLLCTFAYCEARADWAVEIAHDSNAGTTDYNAGLDRICGRYFFDTGTSFLFCPVVGTSGDPHKDSFEIAVADKLWNRWEGEIRLNRTKGVMDGGVTVRRVAGDGPFQMYIGGSYWIDQSPGSNSNFTFNLGLRYTF